MGRNGATQLTQGKCEDSIEQGNLARRKTKAKPDLAAERPERTRTKCAKGRHRHGLCNIARGKAERKRSLKNKIYHLGQHGNTKKAEGERRDSVLVRPRHRTTRAAVCVSKAHLHGLR